MKRERGFAMLLLFVMAAAVAITLYMEMPRVAFEAQRDKEQLLIERGEQYSRAIALYVRKWKKYPATMEELESTNQIRFLRRRYNDPMTGKSEWRLVHVGAGGQFLDSLVHKPPAAKEEEKAVNTFTYAAPAIGSAEAQGQTGAAGPAFPQLRPSERIGMRPPGQTADPLNPQATQQANGQVNPNQQMPGYPQQQAGYPQPGYQQQAGYPQPGYQQQPGYPQPGYPQQPGSPQPGYQQQAGYPQPGYPQQPGSPQAGFGNYPNPNQPGVVPLPPGMPGLPPGVAAPPGAYPQTGVNPQQQQGVNPLQPGQLPLGMPPGYPMQPANSQTGGVATPYPYSTQPGVQGAPPPVGQPGATANPGQPGPGQNQALGLINQLLTQPRGVAPAGAGSLSQQPGTTQIGGGIAGVASTLERGGIKVYNEKEKYNEWEFLFDLTQDKTGLSGTGAPGIGQQPGQNPAQNPGIGQRPGNPQQLQQPGQQPLQPFQPQRTP